MPFDRLATAVLGEPKVGWPAERHAPAHFSDMHTSCQMGLPGLENIYFSVNAFKNEVFVIVQADVARLPSGPTGANRSTRSTGVVRIAPPPGAFSLTPMGERPRPYGRSA